MHSRAQEDEQRTLKKRASGAPQISFAFGYRDADVHLPADRECQSGVTVRRYSNEPVPRRPVQYSLGPVLHNAAPPMPDVKDDATLIRGCLNRFCAANPQPDARLRSRLRKFVAEYVDKHYQPLRPGDISDVFDYIDGTNHPEWRREELREAARSLDEHPLCRDDYSIKSHGKRETYPSYKHARGINSRCDRFKVFSGPFFQAIEHVVFADPSFIKLVPYKDRAATIIDALGHLPGPFYETDYSHFESHFTPDVLRDVEFVLYKHMLANYPGVLSHIMAAMSGINNCRFPSFLVKIKGVRMSGEMCTSLGNGFTNKMLFSFIVHEKGGECLGFVEGDDALMASTVDVTESDFRKAGFVIKILRHTNIYTTGFCGLNMSRDLCAFADPHETLLNFGWTHSVKMRGGKKTMRGLLRAKAMSLLYQNPRCPILAPLALHYIALTEGFKPLFESNWWEQQMNAETQLYHHWSVSEAHKGISLTARSDFADLYGISISAQIAIERRIHKWGFGPIRDSLLDDSLRLHHDAYDYFLRYVSNRADLIDSLYA